MNLGSLSSLQSLEAIENPEQNIIFHFQLTGANFANYMNKIFQKTSIQNKPESMLGFQHVEVLLSTIWEFHSGLEESEGPHTP